MTGPVPVLRPHASQAFDNDNDLEADRPMDQDELLDYADQGPLPSPTATAVAQFLSDMPDFMEGIEESLQRALDSLPVPTPGPSPDGISIHEAIRVSSVTVHPNSNRIRYCILLYTDIVSYVSDMVHDIGYDIPDIIPDI